MTWTTSYRFSCRKLFLVPITLVLIVTWFYSNTFYSRRNIDWNIEERQAVVNEQSLEEHVLQRNIIRILKHLARANRYARRSSTKSEIHSAMTLFNTLLHRSICGSIENDTFTNGCEASTVADPLLTINSVDRNIKNVDAESNATKAFVEQVSLILDLTKSNSHEVDNIVSQLNFEYPGISIMLLVQQNIDLENTKLSTISIQPSKGIPNGKAWNSMLQKVGTNYVLLWSNLHSLNNLTNLPKLLQTVQTNSLDIAAGSLRLSSGHWYHGCYQTSMVNYAYRFEQGYDLSLESETCVLCDYVASPFLIKTSLAKVIGMKHHLSGNVMFLDFFERSKQHRLRTAVCGSAMFFLRKDGDFLLEDFSRESFRQFGAEFQVHAISNGFPKPEFSFNCEELGVECGQIVDQNFAQRKCCLRKAFELLYFFDEVCLKSGIKYEIAAETAEKLAKANGNIFFLKTSIQLDLTSKDLQKLPKRQFFDAGYGFQHDKSCLRSKIGRNIRECISSEVSSASTGPWKLVLRQVNHLSATHPGLSSQTLIQVEDHWLPSVVNPLGIHESWENDDGQLRNGDLSTLVAESSNNQQNGFGENASRIDLPWDAWCDNAGVVCASGSLEFKTVWV